MGLISALRLSLCPSFGGRQGHRRTPFYQREV